AEILVHAVPAATFGLTGAAADLSPPALLWIAPAAMLLPNLAPLLFGSSTLAERLSGVRVTRQSVAAGSAPRGGIGVDVAAFALLVAPAIALIAVSPREIGSALWAAAPVTLLTAIEVAISVSKGVSLGRHASAPRPARSAPS